jgi:teneurin
MLANGGGSVTLQFQRQPFQTQNVTVIVPWNRIITMDAVTMLLDSETSQHASDQLCTSEIEHDHYKLKPVVLATWRHSQLGCCDDAPTAIVPEMRVNEHAQMFTLCIMFCYCCLPLDCL